MPAVLKHIGRITKTGAKVLVAFRTLPGESNMALAIPVANLSDSYHDAIMKVVESDQAQETFEFGELLFIRSFPDGRPMLQALRADGFLQKVPTLVIKGEEEPRTDGNVMNWIYERRMKDTSSQQPAPTQRRNNDPAAVKEPEAWVQAEFGGMGPSNMASYSFIDSDTRVEGNGGDSMPGSFYFLNGASAPASKNDLYGNGGGGGGEKRTKREQMFDNQMEEYMKNRDMGMPKAPPRV